jgi:hypothetical protein
MAVIAAVASVFVLALGIFLAVSLYSGSHRAKSSLIVQYFQALAKGDTRAIADLTSGSFSDQLGVINLKRGSYELYDLGESSEGVLQFIVVLTGAKGGERAILADMKYSKHGLARKIESINLVDQGNRLKE